MGTCDCSVIGCMHGTRARVQGKEWLRFYWGPWVCGTCAHSRVTAGANESQRIPAAPGKRCGKSLEAHSSAVVGSARIRSTCQTRQSPQKGGNSNAAGKGIHEMPEFWAQQYWQHEDLLEADNDYKTWGVKWMQKLMKSPNQMPLFWKEIYKPIQNIIAL